MNHIEINEQLRLMINELVNAGYKKTIIGKLILGTSGYAPIMKYLTEEDINFGVKPLSKVGDTIGYKLHLVYINDENKELSEEIQNMNSQFFNELKEALISYMSTDEFNAKKTRKRTNHLEVILDEIFQTKISGSEDAELE